MESRSAIWGGATAGLLVGLVLGFFVGHYWSTVLYSVLVGAGLGLAAEILGRVSDQTRRRKGGSP